jgi:hypothetical protein
MEIGDPNQTIIQTAALDLLLVVTSWLCYSFVSNVRDVSGTLGRDEKDVDSRHNNNPYTRIAINSCVGASFSHSYYTSSSQASVLTPLPIN